MGASLHGERVLLRPLEERDVPRLAVIAAEPEVARWWHHLTEQDVRKMLEPDAQARSLAVELEGEVIGLAQYVEENEPDYRHASIDLFLGTAWHGQGLGADTVRTVVRHLVDDLGHHRVTIDPAAANERAIRAYERVGFKRVGVMRQYERGPDGEWYDGLLLDLLAEELDPGDS